MTERNNTYFNSKFMEYLFAKPEFQVQNFRTIRERIHFEIYYQED